MEFRLGILLVASWTNQKWQVEVASFRPQTSTSPFQSSKAHSTTTLPPPPLIRNLSLLSHHVQKVSLPFKIINIAPLPLLRKF
jgi:hypothetical protein